MQFADRMTPIKPSATLAVTAAAKRMVADGIDVVGFGAGEPDFDTPDFVVNALRRALDEGKTRYTPAAGVPQLRDAIAAMFTELYGTKFERNEVMTTVGGKHALYNMFQVLLNKGDEVIIPAPFWVSYPAQVMLAEGKPVHVQCNAEDNFSLDVDKVRAAVTERTAGLVLNSPCNPTGAVLSPETLGALADLAEEKDFWIISDDIYSYLRYDGSASSTALGERPHLKDRIFIVHGASKTYAMTGWRIGFAGGPAELIAKMSTLQGQCTSNPTAFAQYGALAALQSDHSFLKEWMAQYDARRIQITALLNDIDGVDALLPGGAFYVFPNISKVLERKFQGEVIGTDLRFAQLLLEHAQVAVVPGSPFGGAGHCRLSYAISMEDIEKGLARMKAFIDGLD